MAGFSIQSIENHLPETWDQIKPIEQGGLNQNGGGITVSQVFETPLVNAGYTLWGKGITTIMSGANCKDGADVYTSEAHILINYDELSIANKEVANTLEKEGNCTQFDHRGTRITNIKFIIGKQTPTQVSERMNELANRFNGQNFRVLENVSDERAVKAFNIMSNS